MTMQTVPLSSLRAAVGNPRTATDHRAIDELAQSILSNGVLQNLIVQPEKRGKYRVVAGTRRLRALEALKDRALIDKRYPVPVEIREDLTDTDALRIATVENVQREALNPIDEADAFAALALNGTPLDEISVKTGLSERVIKRRLALAKLCPEAKDLVRKDELPLSVAEALTLGGEPQQRTILQSLEEGYTYEADEIRAMLLEAKPSMAMAVFPIEEYTGTLTKDLFADEETTYFDDVEQFHRLQQAAVEALAEKHVGTAAWVHVLHAHSVPWWQYREAEEGEAGGVIINLSPTGHVEIREGLVRHEVPASVTEATRAEEPAAAAPRPRPAYSAALIRYIAAQKSLAVQASLVDNPRKAREVAVILLLGCRLGGQAKVEPHPSLAAFVGEEAKPKAYERIETKAREYVTRLCPERAGSNVGRESPAWERLIEPWKDPAALYETVQALGDQELDDLITFLLVLCFGEGEMERLSASDELFVRVAQDLGVDMRQHWRPDETFLSGLRRERLSQIAIESGATVTMGNITHAKKSELVRALARHFARTAAKAEPLDEWDQKGRGWLPGAMLFPAVPEETSSKGA
jgi:ParB family chromosome partitioning protein